MGGRNGGPGDEADGGDGEEGGDRVKGGGHALFSHHRQALSEYSRCYHTGPMSVVSGHHLPYTAHYRDSVEQSIH